MGAFTYPRSEPGSAGHLDLVERLHSNTAEVQRLVAGSSEDAAAARPSESDWSVKEVLGHLCDYAFHLHDRLYRMIKLEEPRLASYDGIAAVEQRTPRSVSLESLTSQLASQRAATVEMLTDLVHWNWARQGRHEEHGRISIRQLVDRAIDHDDLHLEQLRRLTR